jgi:nitric oxide reductase activation protein
MQMQGKLDRRRYVAAVKGAEAVRQRTEEKPATSMAISMTLDFSGSMGTDIRSGRLHDAAMVLSAAFDELDMPYEVRGHGDSATQYKAFDDGLFEPERSAMLTVDNLSGNSCTAPVMGLAANALMARDETNKLVISMTDGELYDHAETCRQLAESRRNGIVTFGVYVSRGRPPDSAKMNELYGKGNWTIVQDIKDMPKAVGRRLVEVFESIG